MKRVMAVVLDSDLFNVDNRRCVSFLVQHSKVALIFQLNSMKNNKKGKICICPTTELKDMKYGGKKYLRETRKIFVEDN